MKEKSGNFEVDDKWQPWISRDQLAQNMRKMRNDFSLSQKHEKIPENREK